MYFMDCHFKETLNEKHTQCTSLIQAHANMYTTPKTSCKSHKTNTGGAYGNIDSSEARERCMLGWKCFPEGRKGEKKKRVRCERVREEKRERFMFLSEHCADVN